MYISYVKNNDVITRDVGIITEKNILEFEKRKKYFSFLYEEALKIIGDENCFNKYTTHYVPKKNNGYRRIDIPNEQLRNYQKEISNIFSDRIKLLFPKSVYAYVKGKNPKEMAKRHVDKDRIIKADIKNFYANCTFDFIIQSMLNVYPFCLIEANILQTIIKPCMVFYDNDWRLPQGAPSSPILSNIAMIPIDFDFFSQIGNCGYTYTRFADDIIISCYETYHVFETSILYEIIEDTLQSWNPQFELNKEKARDLKTNCGNVWMLGLSVGKEVKIGNRKKQLLKATIWSFLNDCKNGKQWNEKDTRHMLGIIGYSKYIEPYFVNEIISKYEKKAQMDFKREVKKILC